MQIRFIQLLLFLFHILPKPIADGIGTFLGLFWFYIVRYRVNLVIDNLYRAFPEKSEKEIRDIARKNFIHYGVSICEFLKVPYAKAENLQKSFVFHNPDRIKDAKAKGRGKIPS